MRYLTYPETQVSGGKSLQLKLKKSNDKFQDTHTIAFKSSEEEKKNTQLIPTQVSSNWADVAVETLNNGDTTSNTSFKSPLNIFVEFISNAESRFK